MMINLQGNGAVKSNSKTLTLRERYTSVRHATLDLCQALSEEDVTPQSMPDASPAKWHMAHTTWFFETFVLEKLLKSYKPLNTQYKELFNSYYNSVGDQYLRPQRGLITRPSLKAVIDYRCYVDQWMQELLLKEDQLEPSFKYIIEVGLQHEQQHQELMLTDIKHLFSLNPLSPVYADRTETTAADKPLALNWFAVEEGLRQIGHDGYGFAFDNECPRHQVYVYGFELASRLISNDEYLAFMQDGGYQRAELWLSDAWQLLKNQRWDAPLYWRQQTDGWYSYTLSGLQKLNGCEPVCHISYYEADAYARWVGARLPTEFEWETVAQKAAMQGHFVEANYFHPKAAQASAEPVQQLYGDVWEWTSSPYTAYPGYQPHDGELAEYNGKFMSNQMVLRGGSCVTPQSHIRSSYRNFFPATARWQFSGIRLARNIV